MRWSAAHVADEPVEARVSLRLPRRGRRGRPLPDVAGIQGHGAAWGDVDGDGWIDLYVGTFHKPDGKPNLFFRNTKGKFQLDEQKAVADLRRARPGVVFADLDNDGDLDLYIGAAIAGSRRTTSLGCIAVPQRRRRQVHRHLEGQRRLSAGLRRPQRDRVSTSTATACSICSSAKIRCPATTARTTKSSRLFRNQGNLQFEDVSRRGRAAGGRPGLGRRRRRRQQRRLARLLPRRRGRRQRALPQRRQGQVPRGARLARRSSPGQDGTAATTWSAASASATSTATACSTS